MSAARGERGYLIKSAPNLPDMTFDNGARARVARGWASTSLDQATYAAQHGISTRTLRDWVCRYGGGRRPHAQLRAAVVGAIEQLQNVLAALDAEAATDSAMAHEAGQEVATRRVERHARSAGPEAPARATRVAPPVGPQVSEPKAGGAEGSADDRTAAAHDDGPVDDREALGSEGYEHVAVVADADLAAARGHTASPASGHQGRRSSENGACGVVDLDALRKRAAQRRAASGAPRRSPFLDWDAE